jgi:pimeloyl-ACP methyl ester carboxylesterase
MQVPAERKTVRIVSGDTECVAWHYPGTNGLCVIMAGGFAVTKEPDTDLFAKRFHEAGFDVLAFGYRRLGESGGQPRQVVRVGEQLADWQAAIEFARGLPRVDPTKLAVWGFSLSGGHVFRVAARNPELAAAIAQTPSADGETVARNAARHQTPLAMLRLAGRGILDGLGGLVGRRPLLSPFAGELGTVALLTTPDTLDGGEALNPGNRYRTGNRRRPPASRFRCRSTGRAATRPACGARCSSLSATRIGRRSPCPL